MSNPGTSTYPAALDAFDDPGTATLQNQAGYSHSALHSQVHDALEKIENVLGTTSGTSNVFAKKNNETFGTPSITGGTIGSAVFTNPIFPTGYPVQMGFASSAAQVSINNTGTDTYTFQAAMTPRYSDSVFYALASINGVDNESSGRVWFKLRAGTVSAGTTGTDISQANVALASEGVTGVSALTLSGTFSPGNLNTQYVKLIMHKQDAGGTPSAWINRYFDQSSIILVEVK